MKFIKLQKQHYQWGLTAFLVVVCCFIVFFLLYRSDAVGDVFSKILSAITPLLYGMVMAYLLCPIYNFTVSRSYGLISTAKHNFKHDLTIAKIFGTLISIALMIVVIAGVLWMIIPGLFDSIMKVIDALPAAMKTFTQWVDVRFAKLPVAKDYLDQLSSNITDYAIDFATNTILPHSANMAAAISGTVFGAIGFVFDFVIGMIVCVYILNIKDTLGAQAKKIIVAHFKESTAEEILQGAEYTNKTFGGFISGKIIDSAIIGILCFIIMSIFGWEYSLLISCIIGITNIIPFFGPFIGAIPSALLLLMVNPMHSLYFIILVIILQQFDGNILGPKILGDSTGLDSFWVLFAVLVGGGLFGFLGMVLSIPVFAVIYAYCGRALNRRLTKRGFSTDTLDYKVDKYRIRKPRTKRKKPELKDNEPINAYTEDEVQETTEEELKEAEEKGHKVVEATLVEYHDDDTYTE